MEHHLHGRLHGEYMNGEQLNYFRLFLLSWRAELAAASLAVRAEFQEAQEKHPDPIDWSAAQEGRKHIVERSKRHEQMINRIDSALQRIRQGTYGYCEITGEQIGLRRMLAVPLATMSVAAQEQMERAGLT